MKKSKLFLLPVALVLVLVCLFVMPTRANAASESDLTFTLNDDGKSYSVTDCNESATGELVIPATYNGKPVTGIGGGVFQCCFKLTNITIPDSVNSIGALAFFMCDRLTSITIPDSVTSIGFAAFSDCYGLTNITIGKGLTNIGREAFLRCNKLTAFSVDINNPNYSSDAFGVLYNKDQTVVIQAPSQGLLNDYVLPDSVTSIGDGAFFNCRNLTDIVIGNNVTSIGNGAFANCNLNYNTYKNGQYLGNAENPYLYLYGVVDRDVTSMTIHNDTKYIGYQAFANCNKLTSVTVGENIVSIDTNAFWWCGGLKVVNFNAINCTFMGAYECFGAFYHAFYGCNELNTVNIGEKVTNIPDGAFMYCSGLTSVTIPDSVTSIGAAAFYGCTGLADVYYGGTQEQWAAINIGSDNDSWLSANIYYNEIIASGTCGESLTWELNGYGTLTISGTGEMEDYLPEGTEGLPHWWELRTAIKTIVINDGVTSIGNNAFNGCTGLTSVTIPDSVTCIGMGAFNCCSGLTSITIPDSVIRIEVGTFYGCGGLTEITIPDSVTSIGSSAFERCLSLTSVTIPDSVTSIEPGAFSHCTGLTGITIPDSVTSIGAYAFGGCTSLTEINIPVSVEKIYDGAFSDSTKLIGIWVDEKNPHYSSDSNGVLFNKDKTTLIQAPGGLNGEYIIPATVNNISDYAFRGCADILSVVIGDGVISIGGSAFSGCSGLTSVTIGDSVTSIGSSAFERCLSLTSVTIPDSVTSINYGTFSGCSGLTSVTIGDSVTSIGSYAFDNCTGLTDVYYNGTQEQWSAITIRSGNDPLLNADIQFAAHYGQKILALGADLSMDFYVAVSEAVATDENAVMQISLGGKVIDEIALKDAKQVEMDDEWYCWYVFTAEIPAKDMTKAITLQLVDSTGNVGDPYTYTVKQYADYLLENSTDEKVLNICQALLDYGAAAEKHFTVRAGGTVADSELANGGDFGTRLDGVTVEDTYKPTKTADITGITCYGTSLILEADTSIRLYFMTDAETWSNVEVAVDVVGAEYNVSQVTNGKAYIEITGIHAADLDTGYTVTITSGTESITIRYGGLSYAWVVMNSSPSGTLANMVKAMYKYWEAAESYNQLPPPEPGDNEFEILPF